MDKSLTMYDAKTVACIQSAYEDLQLMIKEIFIDLLQIPDQLSLNEFITLFEKFDWIDIVAAIEEFCPLAKNDYRKSLNDLILNQLFISLENHTTISLQKYTTLMQG